MRFLSGSVLSGLVLATVVNGSWVKGGLDPAGGRTMATRLCEPAALFRPRLKLEVLEAGTQLAPSQLGLQRPICCPHLYPTIQPRFTFSREYRAEHRDEHITAVVDMYCPCPYPYLYIIHPYPHPARFVNPLSKQIPILCEAPCWNAFLKCKTSQEIMNAVQCNS